MRNVAKLAAAGALSLAIVSGTAFAATAPASQPAKAAVTKKTPAKTATHAVKKVQKKAH